LVSGPAWPSGAPTRPSACDLAGGLDEPPGPLLLFFAARYFFLKSDRAMLSLTTEFLVDGAAAITFGFSFLGFLASRLLRCCPLAMAFALLFGFHQQTPDRSAAQGI
jgi:hypothetical protein